MRIETRFDRGEKVLIIGNGLEARIECVKFNGEILYEVFYWESFTQKSIWLYEDELKKLEKPREIGISPGQREGGRR